MPKYTDQHFDFGMVLIASRQIRATQTCLRDLLSCRKMRLCLPAFRKFLSNGGGNGLILGYNDSFLKATRWNGVKSSRRDQTFVSDVLPGNFCTSCLSSVDNFDDPICLLPLIRDTSQSIIARLVWSNRWCSPPRVHPWGLLLLPFVTEVIAVENSWKSIS
eukprot:GHVU01137633.1.p1 GENE.GHVU01137633.1~~GHVU01137633.1.p1  ORF type:complete len:161 (-),score=0.81 GHVU01137633.1:656-1138(-)